MMNEARMWIPVGGAHGGGKDWRKLTGVTE